MERSGVQYDIQFKIDEINSKLAAIERQFQGVGVAGSSTAQKIESSFSGLGARMISGLAIGTLVYKMAELGGQVISVRSDFERYNAILTNSYGSSETAAEKMDLLKNSAKDLPAELTNLAASFVLLNGRGIEPTKKSLTEMSDFASVTGKKFEELTQAILDVNNTERWKEFGVKARTAGDQVEFSFRKAKIVVDNTEAGAMKAIQFFGNLKGVAGASAAQMEAMGGKVSNLGDSWDQLLNTLGEGGAWKASISMLTEFNTKLTEILKGTEQLGKERGGSFFQDFADSLKGNTAEEAWGKIGKQITFVNERIDATSAALKKVQENNDFSDPTGLLGLLGWEISDTDGLTKQLISYQEQIKKLKGLMNDPVKLKSLIKTEEDPALLKKITTLETLKAKLKELDEAYQKTDITDTKRLSQLDKENKALKLKISNLENLVQRVKAPEKLTARGSGRLVEFGQAEIDAANSRPNGSDIIARNNAYIESYNSMVSEFGTIAQRKELELANLTKFYADNKLEYDENYYRAKSKIIKSSSEEEVENLKIVADALIEIGNVVGGYVGDEFAKMGEGLENLVQGYASGNYVQAAAGFFKLVYNFGRLVDGTAKNEKERAENLERSNRWLTNMTNELQKQLAITKELKGIETYSGFGNAIAVTESNITKIEEKLRSAVKILTGVDGGGVFEKSKSTWLDTQTRDIIELKNLIQEATVNQANGLGRVTSEGAFVNQEDLDMAKQYVAQLEAAQAQLKELQNSFNESVTDSSYSGLVDSIKQAADDGKITIQEMADFTEEAFKKAVLRSFEIKYLETQMQEWFNAFGEANKDGEFTASEREDLQKAFQDKMDAANKGLQEMINASGVDFSKKDGESSDSLAAGFKALTEDTGNALAGQMGAMRITQLEQKNIAMQGLSYLQEIAVNTRYNRHLEEIRDTLKLGSINSDRANGW
jgi:hypothetical protein